MAVKLDIELGDKDAKRAVTSFVNEAEAAFKRVEGSINKMSSGFSSFVGNFSADVAIGALKSLGSAVQGVAEAIVVDGINSAIQYQDALNQLAVSFNQTGIGTEAAVRGFEDFANQLEESSKFTDDQILSNAALIQSLGGLSEQGLERATQAAVDLASALGKDLATTSELVAKAANGNVTAFGKLGIEIRKGANDTETFANTLKVLESRFGGAGLAALQTFSGATTQAKNAFDDFIKEIGNLFVKSPALIGLIGAIGKELGRFTDLIKVTGGQKDPFKELILGAIDVAKVLNTLTEPFVNLFRTGDFVIKGLVNLFVQLGQAVTEFGLPLDRILNKIGLESDETLAKAEALGKFFQDKGPAAADAFAESFGNLGQKITIDEEIGKSFSRVEEQVAKTSGVITDSLGGLSGKAGSAARAIDEAFLNKQIDIAIKFGSPEELQAKLDEQFAIIDAAQANRILTEEEARNAKLATEAEFENKLLEARTNAAILQNDFDANNQTAKLLFQRQIVEQQLALVQQGSEKEAAIKNKAAQLDKLLLQQRLQQSQTFFGDISSLMQTKNKELFEIGKAAALANAIVGGFLAVQNALQVPPFPVGVALAAAAAIKAAVQISGIQSTSLATGITEVPTGFPNDTFPANLTSGERVLSVAQNQDLNQFLKKNDEGVSGGSNSKMEELMQGIISRLDKLENTTIVNIGNKEIVREVREGLRAGQVLA